MSETPEQIIINPDDRKQKLLEAIQSARQFIKISIFRCTDKDLLAELENACKRGVDVKVLLSRKVKGWKEKLNALEQTLTAAGTQVQRYHGEVRKYHAKYLIVDGRLAGVMSFNFTKKCFRKTHDFGLLTKKPELIDGLETLFNLDWNRHSLENLNEQLLVSPINSRRTLKKVIGSATGLLQIVDHKITDPEMTRLLVEKAAAGVRIEVLGNGQSQLARDGIRVNGFLSGLPHGKLILVDNRVAIIGSISLSAVSLDRRRELSVLIEDPDGIAKLGNFFREHFL